MRCAEYEESKRAAFYNLIESVRPASPRPLGSAADAAPGDDPGAAEPAAEGVAIPVTQQEQGEEAEVNEREAQEEMQAFEAGALSSTQLQNLQYM